MLQVPEYEAVVCARCLHAVAFACGSMASWLFSAPEIPQSEAIARHDIKEPWRLVFAPRDIL
jgi:hypothetical protein